MKTMTNKKDSGFTLLEMLVAIFIFSIVVTVASGSIISMINANQKARSVKAVMNNLNLALEAMSRDIRFGQSYSQTDCPNNKDCLKINKGGDLASRTSRDITYKRTGNKLVKTVVTGQDVITSDVTSIEVNINRLNFYYTGAGQRGQRVLVIIGGEVLKGAVILSSFNLQTTVTQRNL